jgi:hypothetical protein
MSSRRLVRSHSSSSECFLCALWALDAYLQFSAFVYFVVIFVLSVNLAAVDTCNTTFALQLFLILLNS